MKHFEEDSEHTEGEILTEFGFPINQKFSFCLFKGRPVAFLVKPENNILLDRSRNIHFLCIGEKGNLWTSRLKKYLDVGGIPLFVRSEATREGRRYICWGTFKVIAISDVDDRRTLGLFQFLQREMAKNEQDKEQELKAVACIARDTFNLSKSMSYKDQLLVEMEVNRGKLSFLPGGVSSLDLDGAPSYSPAGS